MGLARAWAAYLSRSSHQSDPRGFGAFTVEATRRRLARAVASVGRAAAVSEASVPVERDGGKGEVAVVALVLEACLRERAAGFEVSE